jgi:hypothetical protein
MPQLAEQSQPYVRFRSIEILATSSSVQAFVGNSYASIAVVEAAFRLMSTSGGDARVALTWTDGTVFIASLPLCRGDYRSPEPFSRALRRRLASILECDLPWPTATQREQRAWARRILDGYQVGL